MYYLISDKFTEILRSYIQHKSKLGNKLEKNT